MIGELFLAVRSLDSSHGLPAWQSVAYSSIPRLSTGSLPQLQFDQDATITQGNSQTTPVTQPPVIPNDVEEDNHDIEVAHMGNDPYFGIPIPEVPSDQSSSSDSIHTNVPPDHQISEHNNKWTKDHPLENIIGELARPVSTRLQLHEQALFCYYDAFLTVVEPKTYKDALTQACWIEAMQEELNEFERLEVWELVPRPDKLKKALYGLKQAPRARYDMLSSFLISQDLSKGSVDPTLFIRRDGKELLLVQIYVDDIIFAASTPELCDLFSKIMCLKFKMSMMGKISFFLGLQISQSPKGIFINQSKYALESLKKYGFDSCDPVDTPMVEKSKLDEDKKGKAIDIRHTIVEPLIGDYGDILISWSSKRHKSAAISSTEAEYIALSGCCAQILWMRSQLTDYGFGSFLPLSLTKFLPISYQRLLVFFREDLEAYQAQLKQTRETTSSRFQPLLKLIQTRYAVLDQTNKPRLDNHYCEEEGIYGPKFTKAYGALHINNVIPRKEKDPGSFTLPCFINAFCFDNALVDLGASVSVMPLSTYLNLGLGEIAHTRLTVELIDMTVKYPKGIAENVLVGIGKFTFPVDFIILDMPEDIKVPLILGRPFLSTARAKIDVYKRKITLRVGEEKIIFKSVKPASSLIKRVYMLSLRERMELDLEARLMGETLVLNRSLDPFLEDYIELNDLNEPFELRRNQGDDLMPTIEEGEVIKEFRTRDEDLDTGINDYPSYCNDDKKIQIDCAHNLKFSCMIGFEFTHVNFFPLLYVNVMSRKFHNSIMKDKIVYKGDNVVGALMNVPIFVGTFFVMTDFAVLEDMDAYRDEGMGDVSEKDKKNGISHAYQKLKGFYKGVLNLGPNYIRDAKMEEWLTCGHISVHEME
ncbi:putative reverse transcriptase domain-containing protein [Tanacetum coccineum]